MQKILICKLQNKLDLIVLPLVDLLMFYHRLEKGYEIFPELGVYQYLKSVGFYFSPVWQPAWTTGLTTGLAVVLY